MFRCFSMILILCGATAAVACDHGGVNVQVLGGGHGSCFVQPQAFHVQAFAAPVVQHVQTFAVPVVQHVQTLAVHPVSHHVVKVFACGHGFGTQVQVFGGRPRILGGRQVTRTRTVTRG